MARQAKRYALSKSRESKQPKQRLPKEPKTLKRKKY